MEPKEISNENQKFTSEPINLAFDRLEEKEIEFCSFQYRKVKGDTDNDSPLISTKNAIELTQEEDIYPLEEIFIDVGLLPEGSHFTSLDISVLKKERSSTINPLDFREVVLRIEYSKISLDKKKFPNIGMSYPSLLALSLKFEIKRLRCISHHEKDDHILEAKNISGGIRASDRNFNSTKYTNKESYLKKVEIEEIRKIIKSVNNSLKLKEEMKEFTDLEIRYINWAVEVLERKGLV
jgi:hypothetical protein